MDAWNIKQIANELRDSFNMCANSFERSMWRVGARKDVKRIVGSRKITPMEQAILNQYGL